MLVHLCIGIVSQEVSDAAGMVAVPVGKEDVRDGYVMVFEVSRHVHSPLREALSVRAVRSNNWNERRWRLTQYNVVLFRVYGKRET